MENKTLKNTLNLDPRQLNVFYLVAREGSITDAAEKLYLTQPTVTHHIKSLEQTAGVKLLTIKKQRVYLTKAGKGLYSYAEEAHKQHLSAEKYLEVYRATNFTIGVAYLLQHMITAIIPKISEKYPEVNICLLGGTSNQVAQNVSDTFYNIGIVENFCYGSFDIKPVRVSDSEQLVFAISPSHPLAQVHRAGWTDIGQFPLILGQSGSIIKEKILNSLNLAGIEPSARIEVDCITCGKAMAELGNSIVLCHIQDVQKEVSEGTLKIVPFIEKIDIPVDILVHNEEPYLPNIVKDFITLTKNLFRESRQEEQNQSAIQYI